MRKSDCTNVDTYLESFPDHTRIKLEELRATIRNELPHAQEMISYNMPAYRQHQVLVYFAGYPHHIGFYPTATPLVIFREELRPFKCGKGSVQFPLDQPLPLDLIKRICLFRQEEDLQQAEAKKKRR